MQSEVSIIDAAGTAAAMLDPLRRRLLEQFREPRSAAESPATFATLHPMARDVRRYLDGRTIAARPDT